MKLLRAISQVSGLSILMILGGYAGLRWSMETTVSLPLLFNVKRLLMHLNESEPTMLQWSLYYITLDRNKSAGINGTTHIRWTLLVWSYSWWLKLLHKWLQFVNVGNRIQALLVITLDNSGMVEDSYIKFCWGTVNVLFHIGTAFAPVVKTSPLLDLVLLSKLLSWSVVDESIQ